MKAWLIYDSFEARRNAAYIQIYFAACARRQINLRLLIAERIQFGLVDNCAVIYYNQVRLDKPDFVICRTINPGLTYQLELLGLPTFNNYHVSSICNDKGRTYQYVSRAKIRIMDTLIISRYPDRMGGLPPGVTPKLPDSFAFPLVIKPANGKGGQQVRLLRDQAEFNQAWAALPPGDAIIQKVASDMGKDVRVYVIGRRIVAAMLRVSLTDFRSNYCLGGRAEIYTLGAKEQAMVHQVIDLFDFGLVGIDFVFDQGQMVFNEIEDVVGSRMLYARTGIDIAAEYIDAIQARISTAP